MFVVFFSFDVYISHYNIELKYFFPGLAWPGVAWRGLAWPVRVSLISCQPAVSVRRAGRKA